jgi:hypothetical protein
MDIKEDIRKEKFARLRNKRSLRDNFQEKVEKSF